MPSTQAITMGSQSPEYEVVNRIGRVVRTFNDAALARRWARLNAPTLGPLVIEEVTIEIKRKRVWTVRARTELQVVG